VVFIIAAFFNGGSEMNKFYLVKFLTNTQDQDGSSLAVYDTYENAIVAYHQTLATFHNAADVLYACVEIINSLGNIEAMEIVDHRPEPEPEPEEGFDE
jgi:hypothetical protein